MATIIVPCKGHAKELGVCLGSLARQSVDVRYETVVVDSASDPDVLSVARGFPGVRVVRSVGNLRPGAARNLGVEQSRSDYLAFIDADCRAEEQWLASALKALRRGAQLVGGPVLHALPWHPIAVTDNMLQFADFGPRRSDGPARYFPACNMALRRDAFLRIDGFPDVGLRSGEDTALCDRLLARWPEGLGFVREMRVRHEGRTGLSEFLEHQSEFGRARGSLGLHLSPAQQRWGRRAVAMPAVVLKRLSYILGRTARWHPAGLLRAAWLLPLILVGLVAWAGGFRRGCQDAPHRLERAPATTGAGRRG